MQTSFFFLLLLMMSYADSPMIRSIFGYFWAVFAKKDDLRNDMIP